MTLNSRCLPFVLGGRETNKLYSLTEQRLVMCSDCLQRSYGENLERLEVVKGETGIERVLFMRLHLLQAIIAFHQGHFEQAKLLLDKVHNTSP